MEQNELNEILELHKDWLNDGWGERANLRGASLRYAYLLDANLRGTNFARLQLREYTCDIWADEIRVGCQRQSVSWWRKLTQEQAEEIAEGGGNWFKLYKNVLFATVKSLKLEEESQKVVKREI